MTNLYWSEYKNMKKEIIELSYLIHFDDNQISIYSVKILEWSNEYNKKMADWVTEQNRILIDLIIKHPNVKKFINDIFVENGKLKQKEYNSFIDGREYLKCFDVNNVYISMVQQSVNRASKKTNFNFSIYSSQYESVLNKNQEIYPKETII